MGVSMKRRVLGLVLGIPAIWLGNLGRVVGVVMAKDVWGIENAMLVHDWVFQAGLIVIVLGIWIIWLLSSKGKIKLLKVFSRQR
jgi:exosortase/archaeosortase family protein